MKKLAILSVLLLLGAVLALAQDSPIVTSEYEISKSKIIKTIPTGKFERENIEVKNKNSAATRLALQVDGDLAKIVDLPIKTVTIEPGSSANITFTIMGRSTGSFPGEITLSGDIVGSVPLNITIIDGDVAQAGNIITSISLFSKKITKGQDLRYVVEVYSLVLEQNATVQLNEILMNLDTSQNETVNSHIIPVNSTVSLTRTLKTKNMEKGDYVIVAEAITEGKKSSASVRFVVNEPLADKKLFFLPIKYLLLILVIMMTLPAGVIMYKKNEAKKKRYANRIDFSLLPKQGPRSAYIGKVAETNRTAYYEIDQLASHTIIAGSTGGGKTVSAEVLVEEALLKGVAVITFDPTAQWTGFLRKSTEKRMLALYPAFGMKPTDARAFNGNVKQIMNAREVIDIKRFIKPGEITCFSINRLEPEEIDVLVANTIAQVFTANLPESRELRLMIIFDEVHRLLPKFGGSGQGFLMIERAVREFRKYGVGLMLISQVLTDFIGETKANIANEIQMRTRDQGDLDRIKTKYGDYILQSLLKAATGTGMMENPSYNRGDPFFIAFRPLLHEHARLSDEELDNYNKYNAIIDDLEFEVEQLAELGIDTFDMTLEMKMALDKVKTGNFNMVNIYLESLTPRLKQTWEKLGKTPKKREIKLLDEKVLKKVYAEAKKDREEKSAEGSEKKEKEIKILRLKSGLVVTSLQELDDTLPTMDSATFAYHVNETKNDFAEWVKQFDEKLAAEIAKAKTKPDLIKAIRTKPNEKEKK